MSRLVLSRKRGQSITIADVDGGEITITIGKITGTKASVIVDAPQDKLVLRSELAPKQQAAA